MSVSYVQVISLLNMYLCNLCTFSFSESYFPVHASLALSFQNTPLEHPGQSMRRETHSLNLLTGGSHLKLT